MTPYDKENDVELTVPENVDVVAHISCPEPIAAVGEELLHDRIAVLEHDIEQRDRRIVTLTRDRDDTWGRLVAAESRISRALDELDAYRERERQILDVIHRHQREDAYRRIHMQVNQVPQSITDAVEQGRLTVDQPMPKLKPKPKPKLKPKPQICDCTMTRSALMEVARHGVERAINSLK
jgi:hypothetical protein